jgi:hypothetical protein
VDTVYAAWLRWCRTQRQNDGHRLPNLNQALRVRSRLEPSRRAMEEVSRMSGRTGSAETDVSRVAKLSILLSILSFTLGIIERTVWTVQPI